MLRELARSAPHPHKLRQNEAPISSVFFPVTPPPFSEPTCVKKPRSSGRELRALTHQRRMDVEGDRAVRRRSRARNLAAVVAVQNLLVVACLLATVYLYLESPALPEDVYIQFNVLSGPKTNTFLEFESIRGQHKLQNDKGKVSISCTGPYVWHMQMCFGDIEGRQVSGTLTLQVNSVPVSSVTVNATKNMVCRGLHRIVYLGAGDVARFHLLSQSSKRFRMVNVSMGLNYLLGNNCEY